MKANTCSAVSVIKQVKLNYDVNGMVGWFGSGSYSSWVDVQVTQEKVSV